MWLLWDTSIKSYMESPTARLELTLKGQLKVIHILCAFISERSRIRVHATIEHEKAHMWSLQQCACSNKYDIEWHWNAK